MFLPCQSHTCASIGLTQSVASYAFLSVTTQFWFSEAKLHDKIPPNLLAILLGPGWSFRQLISSLFCLMLKTFVIRWDIRWEVWWLHCIVFQQNQGVLFLFFWREGVCPDCHMDVWMSEACASSWPCGAQTQQLRLRLAGRKTLSTHKTYCNVCFDFSFLLPLLFQTPTLLKLQRWKTLLHLSFPFSTAAYLWQ